MAAKVAQFLAAIHNVKGVGRIVSETSSNPGMNGVYPTPVDADHLSICKPTSADDLVVLSVSEFISKNLTPTGTPSAVQLVDLLVDYNSSRGNAGELANFKEKYKANLFTWDVVVRAVYPQEDSRVESRSAYQVSLSGTAKGPEWVLARFPRNDSSFETTIRVGTKIRISGVLSKETAGDEIILRDCKLIERLEAPVGE